MGARGPKPTPTAILQKRGSWLAKVNRNEPLPPDDLPIKPDDMNEDSEQLWTMLEPMLANMGVLKQPDGLALQQLVSIWAEWHKYDQYLQNNPDTLEVLDNNGMIREIKLHPYVKQRSKCSDQLDKHLANFGLTPSSRSRISLDPKDKKKKTGKIT